MGLLILKKILYTAEIFSFEQLNLIVCSLMNQIGTKDPLEVVRLIHSGEYELSKSSTGRRDCGREEGNPIARLRIKDVNPLFRTLVEMTEVDDPEVLTRLVCSGELQARKYTPNPEEELGVPFSVMSRGLGYEEWYKLLYNQFDRGAKTDFWSLTHDFNKTKNVRYTGLIIVKPCLNAIKRRVSDICGEATRRGLVHTNREVAFLLSESAINGDDNNLLNSMERLDLRTLLIVHNNDWGRDDLHMLAVSKEKGGAVKITTYFSSMVLEQEGRHVGYAFMYPLNK